MKKSDMDTQPCAVSAEKLAALHADDLTSAEQKELDVHLESCDNCAQTYRDYRRLASLVRELPASEPLPDLPEVSQMLDRQEAMVFENLPILQPGVTSSLLRQLQPMRRRRSVSGIVLAAGIVVVLVAGALLGNTVLLQRSASPVVSQGQAPVHTVTPVAQGQGPVYTITPQGGPPPTAQASAGGPLILTSPTPPFFVDGNIYRNTTVYSADTGAPIQQYLKELGNVEVFDPRVVNGVLYMAVRLTDQGDKIAMYALRTSDGVVLWKFDTCGECDNMSSPTIANGTVYFMCEAAPNLYWLYALKAETGAQLWRNTFSGQGGFSVLVNQQTLYIHLDNQILAEDTKTGVNLWKQTFAEEYGFINQILLSNGILYIRQIGTFLAERASDGVRLWEYHFSEDYSVQNILVDQNIVYLYVVQMSGSANIYALDAPTGRQRWQVRLDSGLVSYIADHGVLYICINVYATPRQYYADPLKRELVAIQGRDGRALWWQDILWNKGKLSYVLMDFPLLSAGDGRVYLADWQPSPDLRNLRAIMGAFSESNGALLWTTDVTS